MIIKHGLNLSTVLICFTGDPDSLPELLLQCLKLEAQIHTVAFPESDTRVDALPTFSIADGSRAGINSRRCSAIGHLDKQAQRLVLCDLAKR